MRRTLALAIASVAAGVWVAAGATPALAHEERTIGKYHVAVGFGEEPAYAGQENSVQMFLHDANDRPVTDLGTTLKVEVVYQGQTMPAMTMDPNFEVGEFGTPGDYRAFFFPTRAGAYSFHFTGSIKGQQVDETFTSGPGTFSSVQDASAVEFPAKDPTTGQLADRLDRDIPRIQVAVLTRAARAQQRANSARTLAVLGVALGALGLLTGVAALVVAARRGRPA